MIIADGKIPDICGSCKNNCHKHTFFIISSYYKTKVESKYMVLMQILDCYVDIFSILCSGCLSTVLLLLIMTTKWTQPEQSVEKLSPCQSSTKTKNKNNRE